MGCSMLGTVQVSALRSSEASSPWRFSVMGSSIRGNRTVHSRGGFCAMERFTVSDS